MWQAINPRCSLLARIFIFFWATLIATLLSVFLLLNLASNELSAQHKTEQMQTLKTLREKIIDALSHGDSNGATALLQKEEQHLRDQFRIYDELGFELLDRYDEAQTNFLRPILKTPPPIFHSHVSDDLGETYEIFVRLRPRLNVFESHHPTGIALRLALALLVSFIGCYLLARSLTKPIRALQQHTHQVIAQLHTSTDISEPLPEVRYGNDELGQLGRDIDYMRRQLLSNFEQKQQLLRDIAHDLRAPLSRQSIALEMLSLDKPERFANVQAQLQRDHDQLQDLLTQTLKWLSHHNEDVTREKLSLNHIMEEIIIDAAFEFPHINFALHAEKKIDYHGDAQLLASALENIIRNAGRFARQQVAITLNQDESSVIICIKDDGDGVPENALSQIFEPFTQIDNARTPSPHKGFGLGLAITKQAIVRHQGRLRAKNNEGLAVEIVLPLKNTSKKSRL